jgi:hypothetical protein
MAAPLSEDILLLNRSIAWRTGAFPSNITKGFEIGIAVNIKRIHILDTNSGICTFRITKNKVQLTMLIIVIINNTNAFLKIFILIEYSGVHAGLC